MTRGGSRWRTPTARRRRSTCTRSSPADETALAAWLADPAAPKIVHASKEAWHALAGRGLPIAGVVLDTELAAYLCQPDRRAYDLTDLAIGYLHRELGADEVSSSGQGALDLELDGTDEGRRAAVRAAAVRDLADVLSGELSDRGATGCWRTSSCRWSTCWRAWSAPASRSTRATCRASRSRSTARCRTRPPRRTR